MHIPDAYLSPATEAVSFAVMVPIWAVAARKTSHELTSRQAPLLSIGAAFCFAIQMFNIPALGGTTAHALGSVLLAILVGRWAAVLGMTFTLAIQALLFGDGGILSLGANSFNMAFVASFVGYGVYRLVAGRSDLGSSRGLIAAAFGSYAGMVVASLSAGILLGIQPTIAHDALGHALYCPFGLGIAVPAMVITHLLVAAPAEAIITVAALGYLWRAFPELLVNRTQPKVGATAPLVRRLAWLLILTPIGLIASGTAFGEWSLTDLQHMVGYTPQGIAKAHEWVKPLLPDYGFGGMSGKPWEIFGYLVSAFVGCAMVALFTRGVLRQAKAEPVQIAVAKLQNVGPQLPLWMQQPNSPLPAAKATKAPWLEKTLLRMRAALAKTIASEEVARSKGLLQSIHPTAKAIGFLSALVATGLATSPLVLCTILGFASIAALVSAVPLKNLAARVSGAVLFFGLVVAAPLSLAAVTTGPIAFRIAGVAFSSPGLQLAATILLRLATGITLTLLWNLTTPWHLLLRSFGSLGVPRPMLTTATLTYRYLFVMLEVLGEMVEARMARQVGACDKSQARNYAGAGTAVLFAKSLALTEETHLAMLARGYEGVVRQTERTRWKLADMVISAVGVTLLISVVLRGSFYAF